METIEDRPGYLRDTRFEAFGQEGTTVRNPPRPTG
jgi:hypothetical protein